MNHRAAGYFDGQISKSEIYSFPTEEELDDCFPEEVLMGVKEKFGNKISSQELFYNIQLEHGFRRSETIIYRETCPECRKCVPIRIPVAKYKATKNARHLMRKNSCLDLRITENGSDFVTEEKILLYQNYWQRHNPGKTLSHAKAFSDVAAFSGCTNGFDFDTLLSEKNYSGTKNFDYYQDGKLIAVSVLDFALDSISSNYFYYDISPEILKRSPGTFSIINEILWAAEHGFEYYYLGYWIKGHPKMNYKANFFPHELYINEEWKEIPSAEKGY